MLNNQMIGISIAATERGKKEVATSALAGPEPHCLAEAEHEKPETIMRKPFAIVADALSAGIIKQFPARV
jgi:hypothetical protein